MQLQTHQLERSHKLTRVDYEDSRAIPAEQVRYFKSPKGVIAINANAFTQNEKSASRFNIQNTEADRQFFFPFFGFWGLFAAIQWPLALLSSATSGGGGGGNVVFSGGGRRGKTKNLQTQI